MEIIPTALEGAYIIEPQTFGDARGYFRETYRADLLKTVLGYRPDMIQQNESLSRRGVLRGMHYQAGEHSQAKLVGVATGRVLDVIVDLRRESRSFGKHLAVELDADSGRRLFIPRGMAHGFLVLSESTIFQYLVDNAYCPASERTLRFDDPTVGIEWPLENIEPILSPKDLLGMDWEHAEKF